MGNLGTVLKWSVSGWSFFIEIIFFVLMMKLICGELPSTWYLISPKPTIGNIIAIVSLIGVPLGYIFYQIYYYFYWTVPMINIPTSSGSEESHFEKIILSCNYRKGSEFSKTLDGIKKKWALDISKSILARFFIIITKKFGPIIGRKDLIGTPEEIIARRIEFRSKWSMIRSIWFSALNDNQKSNESVASTRFEYLTSAYDCLGGVNLANWIALIVSFIMWVSLLMDEKYWLCRERFRDLLSSDNFMKIYTLIYIILFFIIILILLDRRKKDKEYNNPVASEENKPANASKEELNDTKESSEVYTSTKEPKPNGNEKKKENGKVSAIIVWALLISAVLPVKLILPKDLQLYVCLLLYPVIVVGICTALNRILWTNRLYIRMSILMLIENYLCNGICEKRTNDECKIDIYK